VDIYQTKYVYKQSKKLNIPNLDWIKAIENLNNTSTTAYLGSHVYKLRLAANNKGKSGGYRGILIYKKDNLILIISVFSKANQENLKREELDLLKKLGQSYLNLTQTDINILINRKALINIGEINE
jgi:hypothetical protein